MRVARRVDRGGIVLDGPAAPSGMKCYRSDAFGREFTDNHFVCYFNLRKVSRHVLVPDGATFKAEENMIIGNVALYGATGGEVFVRGMAGERFIACAGFTWLRDIAALLRAELGDDARRVPTLNLPDWSVRLLARVSPLVRNAASELGTARHQDSSHARTVLGWAPRAPREAILQSARDLIKLGVVGR